MTAITLDAVSEVLERHTPIYRHRPPVYQAVMLGDLAAVWDGRHATLLDIGGGTGVMAEAIAAAAEVPADGSLFDIAAPEPEAPKAQPAAPKAEPKAQPEPQPEK